MAADPDSVGHTLANSARDAPKRRACAWPLCVLGLAILSVVAVACRPPAPPPGHRAGEMWTNPKDGLEYTWIPEGTFQMGCVPGDRECLIDESPHHEVVLTRGFWMGRTKVTVGAYHGSGQSAPSPGFPQDDPHPVVKVRWADAQAFCEGSGGRLPTEAEWEYAARGGQKGLRYPWGNDVSHEHANYGRDECCDGWALGRDGWVGTSPVASFDANGFGLYDMAGNVYEWCADWYDQSYYSGSPKRDPKGPAKGNLRVIRGGSWFIPPVGLRTSDRDRDLPGEGYSGIGFRCVRDVP